MTVRTSCSCNFQEGKVEVTSSGGGYFGELNPTTQKVKLNLWKTIKSHVGNLIIWIALVLASMASLATAGLLFSLPLRLFNVDISSLDNWFFNIFRFGKFPNIFLPSLWAAFQYAMNSVQAYMMYSQQKQHVEYQQAEQARRERLQAEAVNKNNKKKGKRK